jgi:hypothetical protein
MKRDELRFGETPVETTTSFYLGLSLGWTGPSISVVVIQHLKS